MIYKILFKLTRYMQILGIFNISRGVFVGWRVIANDFSYYTKDLIDLTKIFMTRYNKKYSVNYSSASECFWFLSEHYSEYDVFIPNRGFHSTLLAFCANRKMDKVKLYNVDTFLRPLPSVIDEITENSLIVVNDYGGLGWDISALRSELPKSVTIILDGSHSHFTQFDGKMMAECADISVLSLQGSKAVPAGEGGFMLTDSQTVAKQALKYSHFNNENLMEVFRFQREESSTPYGIGHKHRMNALGASLALFSVKYFPKNRRSNHRRNGAYLTKRLGIVAGINEYYAMGFPIQLDKIRNIEYYKEFNVVTELIYPRLTIASDKLSQNPAKTDLVILRRELFDLPHFIFKLLINKIVK